MGCSINPTSWGGCAADALGGAAGGLASAGFDAVVKEFAQGVGKIVKTLSTFWLNVPTEKPSTAQGTPVGMLTAELDWVMLAVGLLSLLLVAARMAITQRGDVLAEAGGGLVRFVLVNAAQIPAIALLAGAGDEFSRWIVNTAADGDFDKRVGEVFGTALATGPLGEAVVFIGALLAIVAALAQVIAMVARNGVLIITAAASPVAAAAAINGGRKEIWEKLWMWQLAFVLYKPVAALIYAAAFVTIGHGSSATDQLSGLALMIMSVLALPALLRLMMPVSSRMSGGGAGSLAGAGVAASGIGSVLASRGGRGSGSGVSRAGGDSGSGGPSGSSGVHTAGAAGSTAVRSGGAADASAAGGGAAAARGGAAAAGAAGGPPGMAIGAAVQAGGKLVGAAQQTAESAASGADGRG